MIKFTIHPTAALFPLIEGQDFDQLCESIRERGLIEPIVRDGNEIIDGRNRLRACEKVGVEARFTEWDELNLAYAKSAFILAKNIDRRHLGPDQRATIWAKGQKILLREHAELKKKASQFKPGNSTSVDGGLAKAGKLPVNTDSCSPARDAKEMHARSTVGQIASEAGVSMHKARQALAVAESKSNPSLADQVISKAITLLDAVKQVAPAKPKRAKPAKGFKKEAVVKRLEKFVLSFGEENKSKVISIILEQLQ